MNDRMEKIKENTYLTSIIPGKEVRAVFYGRVSTDNEEQKDSCENQLYLAKCFVSKHPNISLVDELIDNGISGKNAIGRPAFTLLIKMITSGEIDLILTKSMSRLHRDEETAIILRRLCMENDVAILVLENEQIIDFDDEGAMFMQSIQSIVDAQYVARQSKYGRMTHKIRCEKKELSAKDICFGYNWNKETKTITINEEEAEIIREIFDMYLYEQKNPQDIVESLKRRGVSNRFSRVDFSSGYINKIIKNEKYIGRFYINKRTTKLGKGMNGKSKRINLPKEEWILIEREDLRIVDQDVYDLAGRLRASRQTTYQTCDKEMVRKRFEGTHAFSNKIKCSCCGQFYKHDMARKARDLPVYRISSHKGCSNKINRIEESVVNDMVVSSIKRMLLTKEKSINNIEALLCKSIEELASNEGEIKKIDKELVSLSKEMNKLSRVLMDEDILSNMQLKKMYLSNIESVQANIDALNTKKNELSIKMDKKAIDEKITHLRKAISEFVEVTTLTRERVLRNVKEIVIKEDGDIDLVLTSGLSYVGKYQLQDVRYP